MQWHFSLILQEVWICLFTHYSDNNMIIRKTVILHFIYHLYLRNWLPNIKRIVHLSTWLYVNKKVIFCVAVGLCKHVRLKEHQLWISNKYFFPSVYVCLWVCMFLCLYVFIWVFICVYICMCFSVFGVCVYVSLYVWGVDMYMIVYSSVWISTFLWH